MDNIHSNGDERFARLGAFAAVIVVLAGAAAQLVNYVFFNLRIQSLDPGADRGVFGVIGDVAFAAAAVSAWVLTARVRSARPAAATLAALLTFLAADDVTRLHEKIPDWPAFYLPVLFVALICIVAVSRGSSRSFQFRVARGAVLALDPLIGAGILLLTLSLLLHVLGLLGVADTSGFVYQAKALVKHVTEIAGWLLIALGLLRLGLPARAS